MVASGVPILVAMGSWIRLIAIAASAIVLLGFGLFALDEMNRGSQNQQHALDSALGGEGRQPAVIVPTAKEEVLREEGNGDVRELHRRINDTVADTCRDVARETLTPLDTDRDCIRAATRDAMAQADDLIAPARG